MNELKTREPGAILVVEDDDVFAAGFIRWLRRRHGFDRFEILVAPSEEAAIRALRQSRRFSGFIVDWRLGSTLTADRVLEHIRQLYPSRRTPVYVATSHALDDDVLRRAFLNHAVVLPKGQGDHWSLVEDRLTRSRRRVLETDRWLHERAALEPLRPREADLAHAVLDGAHERALVDALDVSSSWVREVARTAASKLGVRHLTALTELSSCA